MKILPEDNNSMELFRFCVFFGNRGDTENSHHQLSVPAQSVLVINSF